MTNYNPPTLSRAPVSVRKMVQILRDPVIFTSVATITVISTLGTWYYYSRKGTNLITTTIKKLTQTFSPYSNTRPTYSKGIQIAAGYAH